MNGYQRPVDDVSDGRLGEYLAAMTGADPAATHPWIIVHAQEHGPAHCGLSVISNIASYDNIVVQMLLSAIFHVSGAAMQCPAAAVSLVIDEPENTPGDHREP